MPLLRPTVAYTLQPSRRLSSLGGILFAQNASLVRCPLNEIPAAEKAELRRQWTTERKAHQVELKTWAGEHENHARERDQWKHEQDVHQSERENWGKVRRDGERRREVERKEFERERERWKQQQEADGLSWRKRQEARRLEEQTMRDAFEAEQVVWRRRQEEEAKHRLEVIRGGQGVYWTELHGDIRCHSYGTRTYTAYLRDLPSDLNWLEVCGSMPPVTIHGRELSKPFKFERTGDAEVIGVWYVDFDEPNCRPYWDKIYDRGCTPGGPRFQVSQSVSTVGYAASIR
ncbi:hypothetical protein C8Q79DRAFT_943463 [Trametes meyenii]|nr:hypothetical protein C8Q79DRAFT_943463 [Trametes meyenii]